MKKRSNLRLRLNDLCLNALYLCLGGLDLRLDGKQLIVRSVQPLSPRKSAREKRRHADDNDGDGSAGSLVALPPHSLKFVLKVHTDQSIQLVT